MTAEPGYVLGVDPGGSGGAVALSLRPSGGDATRAMKCRDSETWPDFVSVIEITIPLEPVAKGRARVTTIGGFARAYTPAKTAKAERTVAAYVAAEMARQKIGRLSGALCVGIYALFTMPKTRHRKRKPILGHPHTTTPDIDNVAKLYLDACNGVLWDDDASICRLWVSKYVRDQGQPGFVVIKASRITGA